MIFAVLLSIFIGSAELCGTTSMLLNTSTATRHAKMKLLLLCQEESSKLLQEIIGILAKDLSFTGQFAVQEQFQDGAVTALTCNKAAQKGFPLMVHLKELPRSIEWRLYNTMNGIMLKGKKYKKKGANVRGWAHALADMIWPELTAQPGFFSSKIAYCKAVDRKKEQNYKHVYIADYDGSCEQPLVATPTVNVAPRFNKDPQSCLVFYSQFTNENVELKVVDMKRRQKTISAFDGINMLPTFSSDGKRVAYCASKGTGNCQIFYFENKKLTQITENSGNNISPTFNADGSAIYFCSDVHGSPSIYCFDRNSQEMQRLTKGAASMSPAYNELCNKVAYGKKTDGVYQIWLYDCATQEHKQITTHAGHKSECCWSPCGNYILYAVEKNQKQFLEMIHYKTGLKRQLAIAGNCSYPAWSICYKELPIVA